MVSRPPKTSVHLLTVGVSLFDNLQVSRSELKKYFTGNERRETDIREAILKAKDRFHDPDADDPVPEKANEDASE